MASIHDLHPDHALNADDVARLASGLKPSAIGDPLRARLKQRVLQTALQARAPSMSVVLGKEGKWIDFAAGIRIKALRVDRQERTHTSLWRLAPGARLAEHDHSADEECLIIDGTLDWDGRIYQKGDYLLARAALHHTEIVSPGGAVLLLRGELSERLERAFGEC